MNCENCLYHCVDEEGEYCSADFDEDEYFALISGQRKDCPFFDPGDEYDIVKHQN